MIEAMKIFIIGFWAAAAEMAPYLLFGFFMAGALSVLISQETVERHIGRRGLTSVIKAAFFGVPLPLCSCGVIPVSMSLRRNGASRDAAVAFLISTPQTGVDSIMVTYSMLGPVFAIVRPVAAMITGVAGGIMTTFFGEKDMLPDSKALSSAPQASVPCGTSGNIKSNENKAVRAMKYGFVTMPMDIGRFIFVGLLIAALISTLLPKDFFSTKMNSDLLQMLVMMAVGIPMYVCSSASVPIAAALIHAGISPGAALVFLMSGPATNAATITTIWKVLGKRTAMVYLFAIAAGALTFGFFLNAFEASAPHQMNMANHWMMPGIVNNISAVLLLAILAQAFFKKKTISGKSAGCAVGGTVPEAGETVVFDIEGMNCSHCVESVTRALSGMQGVNTVRVELDPGRASITGDGFDTAALLHTVEQLGYKALMK